MMALFINLLGIGLIFLVIWWFWMSQARVKPTKIENIVDIKVENGVYQPANIEATVNHLIVLRFIREDPSPCAETVVFHSLNVSKQLPLHQPVTISLNIKEAGDYEFTCQMGMYRGKLIVTDK